MPTPTPHRPDPGCSRYVRRVRNGAWQARLWLGPRDGRVNLGLFPSERDARRAVRAAVRALAGATDPTPLGVWVACRPLLGSVLPAGLLPKYVRRAPGGFAGAGVPGVFPTPEDAHLAAAAARAGGGDR